jgi:hypothetical protein
MKPECIEDYNQHMQGVYTTNQYLALYPFIRKTCKWKKESVFLFVALHSIQIFLIVSKAKPPEENHISQFHANSVPKLSSRK